MFCSCIWKSFSLGLNIYNGEEQEIVKTGSTNDGQILYSLDGVNFSEKLPTATKVGKYKVYYRIVGDKNHLDSEINNTTEVSTKTGNAKFRINIITNIMAKILFLLFFMSFFLSNILTVKMEF